jgi:16S rRNA (uracil1498-N3)-methyltransferase
VVLVGPEGGLTEDEMMHLRDLGAEGIRLGKRILRVETAAIASAALLLAA